MTTILSPFAGWPNTHLMDRPDHILELHADRLVANHSSSPISSASSSPRIETYDSHLPAELTAHMLIPNEHSIQYGAAITQAQLYALQELRSAAGLYSQQNPLMLQRMVGGGGSGMVGIGVPYVGSYVGVGVGGGVGMEARTLLGEEDVEELPERNGRVKRKRGERMGVKSVESEEVGEESDEESAMERSRSKMPKLLVETCMDGELSDITSLLSLPQKEAAQRLGISESMLCKRFKECTRRKWPFRLLRKIEKTIATLESQQTLEPLSSEDQDKLQDLHKQRVECLAPVKIRITKSPSPVPFPAPHPSLLTNPSSQYHHMQHRFSPDSSPLSSLEEPDDSDDDSDTRETDFESEAIESLIHLSRSTTPRSFFPSSGIAC